jgi:hypothetical protein
LKRYLDSLRSGRAPDPDDRARASGDEPTSSDEPTEPGTGEAGPDRGPRERRKPTDRPSWVRSRNRRPIFRL